MTNIKTPITGIVRNSPDSDSDMGSAQEIINLRYKDNAWRTIGKKKKLGTIISSSTKQLGWYHHPSNTDNLFISFDNTSRKILLHNITTGSNVVVKKRNGSDFVLPSDEDFNCFTHLENVLVLLGTKDRYNFLWINGAFEYVEFGNIDWTLTKTAVTYNVITTDTSELATGQAIQNQSTNKTNGKLSGICAFRLAIELSDGSFSWYSDIKLTRAIGVDYINEVVRYGSDGIARTLTLNYENLFAPKLIEYRDQNSAYDNTALYMDSFYKPVVSFTIPEWITYYIGNGVIKALHVCATKEISPYFPQFPTDWYMENEYTFQFSSYKIYKSTKTDYRIDFPADEDIFYSIYEVNAINKIAPSATEIYPFTDIKTRKEIPVDNFTGNKTSAKYSFLYNQRLHLQQIYNSFPRQYDIINEVSIGLYQYTITSGYDAYVDILLNVNQVNYVIRKKIDFILFNKWITSNPYTFDYNSVYISRQLYYPHSSCKAIRVSFSKDGENFYTLINGTSDMNIKTALNISKAIVDANITTSRARFDYSDLHPSDENKNWWQYDNTRFLILQVPDSGIDYATHNSCELCTELPATYIDTNRLQLSETSNPFVLPALNSYRFGDINNELNGVEVTKDQLSETRFGQFPLYVFSTQGVFALEQGTGSVAYASTNYIDKYIVEDHECIKAIKGSVIFRTKYGFYALSARSFQEISTQLEGSISVECSSDSKYSALLAMFSDPTSKIISDINPLNTADMICTFDFINDEVWFSPKLLPISGGVNEEGFSYIFNITSKRWYKVSEAFSYFIDISPNVVGIKESLSTNYLYNFYDMHTEDDFSDLKLFVSRPISFGSKYYKRIEHFVARLKVKSQSAKTLYFYLYGSIDGIEYKILQGGEISTINLQDQEIRRTFVDFKWLQIVIGFKHEECEIMGFESEVKEKFKTKLR